MELIISEVQKRNVLWNKLNTKYRDRLVSEKKWEAVARIVNINNTTTPRITEGNISDENEMSDLSDLEEDNSFCGIFNDTQDILSPENPVPVPELSFIIQNISNLSHDDILTSISNDSDTFLRKPSAIKKKEKTSFESELIKLEN
ncbi:MADF domain [Cinara cedri]|uniref:MADF domain n=1 Tax=Cinara cedri TaxID=506608 RepID=A0A5E4NF81_9HEMI|nr:MADF domain [Cinara cedri]